MSDREFDGVEYWEVQSNDWLEPVEDEPYVFDQFTERFDDWEPIFVLELKANPRHGVDRGVVIEHFLGCWRFLEEQGKHEDLAACKFLGPSADRPDVTDREGEESVFIAVRESVQTGERMVTRIVPLVRLKFADEGAVGTVQQPNLVARLLEISAPDVEMRN